ncbi:MAG: family 78 glycoside hydrolase catalytic domain [Kiritimatiellae bacterium]|nr:family 78 glycoside hydrolase catalytic domain [Kiritimatiellia bacterium]
MRTEMRVLVWTLCCWAGAAAALTPDGLMCELLAKPGLVPVTDETPEFSWGFKDGKPGDFQTAYQIQVATTTACFKSDKPDLWDSGKVNDAASLHIPYAGESLPPDRQICWRVRVWDMKRKEGPWSQIYAFKTAEKLGADTPLRYPLVQRKVEPVRIATNAAGKVVVDFGRAAFGWLELVPPQDLEQGGDFVFHVGEKLAGDAVDRNPGGTIRYAKTRGALTNSGIYRVPFTADKRNTSGAAVRLPSEIGVVMPFRYVEVETCPFAVTAETIRQIAVTYPFDTRASAFVSSCDALDQVYRFCKYSIRMTTFAGVYVDGDRERIPYEADAYLNQLSHYALDREFTLARYSHEYLMEHPTWPTEWKQHSIMMAWQDWMYTGNTESLARCYEALKTKKLLDFCAREDGLLVTNGPDKALKDGSRDIVDWPIGERDGFEFKTVNTVINAFHVLNLRQMADIAAALGKTDEAARFRERSVKVAEVFHKTFYNVERGCYVDGEGSTHASIHANMLPLAFGIVPEAERARVAAFVARRDMSCSVYGAQYLLEALFEAGLEREAIHLMTRPDIRGWLNMMKSGSTVTLEAWDKIYKPNLDWNHAWGAAPANIIPRYVLGVRPLEPGFGKILIRPQLGDIRDVEGVVPTIRGSVKVGVRQEPGRFYQLKIEIPCNTTARIEVPAIEGMPVYLDGVRFATEKAGSRCALADVASGAHLLTIGETPAKPAGRFPFLRRLFGWLF